MRLSRQFQVCLFFLRKNFEWKREYQNAKQTISTLLEVFARKKIAPFTISYSLIFVLLVGFCLWCVFRVRKFFLKKIFRLEIVLITSIIILLMCAPIDPPMESLFFTNFVTNFFTTPTYFLCVCTYFYLCNYLLICQNLFSSVRISSYLSKPIFIRAYLLIFVKTYFRLSKSIFICVHLFLSARISFFLWSSLRIFFFIFDHL